MHRIIRTKAYEAKHGPHFDEEHARKAVSKMENEDGSRGQHWSVEETSALANQYGIRFDSKFNKYDWYVALNMVYSDYYKVIVNMTGSNNSKYFVELAKAWNGVNLNLTKMGYENQLAVCNQTNNLVNTMNSNTLSLRDNGTANTNAIIAKLDAMQNQALLDKIDSLREKNSTLVSQLSQEHQTATFGTMISQATTPIVTKLNALQSDVDGIKCKLPNTVSVPYPQLSVYNPEVFKAAAYGAFAGDTYANCGIGYNNCGC